MVDDVVVLLPRERSAPFRKTARMGMGQKLSATAPKPGTIEEVESL